VKKSQEIIQIKNQVIPIRIRSYNNAKRIRIFFNEDVLCISKPTRFSLRRLEKLIAENEEIILEQYEKAKEKIQKQSKKNVFLFQGEEYVIVKQRVATQKRITIQIDKNEKQLILFIPEEIELKEETKKQINKKIIQILKEETKKIIEERLLYWKSITKFEFKTVRISDTKSKYGSCIPQRKALQFSARLCMLSDKEIDGIIVHELCHLKYANHSKQFYELIEKYLPDYKETRKKLKQSGNKIIFEKSIA